MQIERESTQEKIKQTLLGIFNEQDSDDIQVKKGQVG